MRLLNLRKYHTLIALALLFLASTLTPLRAQQAYVPLNYNYQYCTLFQPCVLGVLRGANFNVTTDQAIVVAPLTSSNSSFIPAATKYTIDRIIVTNCSTSLTTAQGGFYTAVSKGGTIVGATTTAYTGCTGASFTNNVATAANLTGLTNQTSIFNAATLYLSLTTAQGGAATADVYLVGTVLQ